MSDLKQILNQLKDLDFNQTDWEQCDFSQLDLDWNNYHNLSFSGLTNQELRRLNSLHGFWLIYGQPRYRRRSTGKYVRIRENTGTGTSRNSHPPSRTPHAVPRGERSEPSGVPSRIPSRRQPKFKIPQLERIDRQWNENPQGYKAMALWQTASLFYDLLRLFTPTLPRSEYRLVNQANDAARSMVANIEEGYARPTSLEFLRFLGFAFGSGIEVDGDIDRMHSLGFLKSVPGSGMASVGIPTPSRNFPYPPVKSRQNPGQYGSLREKLREFTGKYVKPEDLTYEALKELSNKTKYLFKRTAEGVRNKIIEDEEGKLSEELDRIWSKYF